VWRIFNTENEFWVFLENCYLGASAENFPISSVTPITRNRGMSLLSDSQHVCGVRKAAWAKWSVERGSYPVKRERNGRSSERDRRDDMTNLAAQHLPTIKTS